MLLYIVQAPPRSGQLLHYSFTVGQPGKGNLHGGQHFGQYPWSYILFEKRNDQMCHCPQTRRLSPMNWLDSQVLGRSMIGKWMRRTHWGRNMWLDVSKLAKDVKILESHVHQKVTLAEEEVNNQADRTARSVDS